MIQRKGRDKMKRRIGKELVNVEVLIKQELLCGPFSREETNGLQNSLASFWHPSIG